MDQSKFKQGITPSAPNALPTDLRTLYRDMHPELLADQLIQLGLFGMLENEIDVARHNYAVEILSNCGVVDDMDGVITQESMAQAVRNLLGTRHQKEN